MNAPGPAQRAAPACDLCGISVGRSRIRSAMNGRTLHFCCPGCQMVFDILFHRPEGPPVDYRDTDLYRACIEAGIIPAPPGGAELSNGGAASSIAVRPLRAADTPQDGQTSPTASSPPVPTPVKVPRPGDDSSEPLPDGDGSRKPLKGEELIFHVGGMWCTTCALLVESILRRTEGVLDARVFFLSDSARVEFLPQRISPERIFDRVSRLGYSALQAVDESESARERRSLQLRLGLASILTANIMMISWALYIGFFQDLGAEGVLYLSWPLWLLSTPVVFYSGAPILNKAFRGALHGAVSMETLITVGAITAYFFSVLQTLSGSLHVYFDTASTLVTLVLLGKTIEAGARDNVARGVTELMRAAGDKARILKKGREAWVPNSEVRVGDEFLVREGERVSMDGEMLEGRADIDESFLTGESKPATKRPPDEILNGTLVLNGNLRARVIRPNSESVIQQMISLIREALAAKVPAEQMADRVMRWIVPSIIILASATGVWVRVSGASLEEALQRTLTVLVITCPCALGIAIPLAKVASISAGKLHGLIIRDPGALDLIRSVDAFVFDKTGTVTEGVFSLLKIVAPHDGEIEVLQRLGAVEACSDHLIAREVVRQCNQMGIKLRDCPGFESHEGMGVRGIVGGEEILVGNRRLMAERNLVIPQELEVQSLQLESEGMSTPFFAWNGSVRGFLCLGDKVGKGSREAIRTLHDGGRMVFLISGDSTETTRSVSGALGIPEFRGGMRPSDKADFVGSLQREGLRVAMVGDGINDAPALALAHVAFTVGSGANLLREVSAITLLKGNLSGIPASIGLSEVHAKVAGQNLFLAFAYNALAIPVAMAGLVNPIFAVAAMFLSSLTVLANTLRIPRLTRAVEPLSDG